MKHVGVFIHVGNLYHSINKVLPGRKLNYRKYLNFAIGEGVCYRAIAYGLQREDEASNFITALGHSGFEAKFFKFRKFEKDGNTVYQKIDLNLLMALDIVRLIEKLDTIVIGSSDPDLVPLIQWIKERGVDVRVIGCNISRNLKDVSAWTELKEDVMEELPQE